MVCVYARARVPCPHPGMVGSKATYDARFAVTDTRKTSVVATQNGPYLAFMQHEDKNMVCVCEDVVECCMTQVCAQIGPIG